MPRVSINKKKYKLKDFSEWLVGRMNSMDLRQADVADMLGISQPAFSQRLKKSMFDLSEILTLFEKLKATEEEILRLMKM